MLEVCGLLNMIWTWQDMNMNVFPSPTDGISNFMKWGREMFFQQYQNIIMQSLKIKMQQQKIGCNTRTNHVAIQVKHFVEIWSYQMISCKVKPKLKDKKCNIYCMRTCKIWRWMYSPHNWWYWQFYEMRKINVFPTIIILAFMEFDGQKLENDVP